MLTAKCIGTTGCQRERTVPFHSSQKRLEWGTQPNSELPGFFVDSLALDHCLIYVPAEAHTLHGRGYPVSLFAGDRFQQGIEVFQAGIFDDHASAAVLVFDRNFQA
jgi:hypothetical protein